MVGIDGRALAQSLTDLGRQVAMHMEELNATLRAGLLSAWSPLLNSARTLESVAREEVRRARGHGAVKHARDELRRIRKELR